MLNAGGKVARVRRMARSRWLVPPLLLLAAGCAVVKAHRIHPDYAVQGRLQTKRLVVVTQPFPDGQSKAGELFSLVARRYVNQKRNFLVKEHRAQAEPLELSAHCAEGLEGVLWLKPQVRREGAGVEAVLDASLLRCGDGQEIWSAQAGGSFESADGRLVEVTKQYVSEVGPEVEPYVAPAFNLLRPTLDTLPNPTLTSEEEDEKIELGD